VQDVADALDGALDVARAPQVAFDELDPVEERGDVVALAGREVVEHADALALGEERLDDVRADEAGATGHEVLGHSCLLHCCS